MLLVNVKRDTARRKYGQPFGIAAERKPALENGQRAQSINFSDGEFQTGALHMQTGLDVGYQTLLAVRQDVPLVMDDASQIQRV